MSYSIYFDKKRDRYILRQTVNGKRKYVSSHVTENGAKAWKKTLESTLDSYETPLIEVDEPRIVKYLKKFKKVISKRRAKKTV